MKSFAVIGLGRFGTRIAIQLASLGQDVLAIDMDEAQVEKVAEQVTRAVTADAKNRAVLEKLGLRDCSCAIVAIGSDLGTSVLIAMNLKALNVEKIVCKAHDETHLEILEKLGVHRVVIPEYQLADKVAASLTSTNVLDYIELSDDYGVVEFEAPSAWVGKSIGSLDIRTRLGVTIIALKQKDKIHVAPKPGVVIEKDMILVLLGDYVSLGEIQNDSQ